MSDNPTNIVHEDGTKLQFVVDERVQRCSHCYCDYFGGCNDAPCNSQDRTDGKMGRWEEKAAVKRIGGEA